MRIFELREGSQVNCPSCESAELHDDLTVVGGKRVCANCSWAEGEPVPPRAELHARLQELADLVVRMVVVYDAALKWCVAPARDSKASACRDLLLKVSQEALRLEICLAAEEVS